MGYASPPAFEWTGLSDSRRLWSVKSASHFSDIVINFKSQERRGTTFFCNGVASAREAPMLSDPEGDEGRMDARLLAALSVVGCFLGAGEALVRISGARLHEAEGAAAARARGGPLLRPDL